MVRVGRVGAVALAIVLAACTSVGDESAEVIESEATTSSTTSPAASEGSTDEPPVADEPDEAVEAETSQERGEAEPPQFGEVDFLTDAPVLIAPFDVVDEGDHRVITTGTELSFTATETLAVQPNFFGHFVLTDFASRGPDDSDIVVLRTSSLSDPTQPWQARADQDPWPANDLVGWVENLADDVIATQPVETTLGGRAAIYTELALAEDAECGYEQGVCIGFAQNQDRDIKGLNPGSLYRVWAVDQGDEDPIFVTAAVLSEADIEWFDRADEILATLAFGETAENPVRRLPAGSSQIGALGGIELSFESDQTVFQAWLDRPYWSTEFSSGISAIDIAGEPRSFDGERLTSTDELIALISEGDIELTEGEPASVDGVAARTFDYTATEPNAILFKNSELDLESAGFGWEPGSAGRLWVIEHPERGLQAISAKSRGAVDSTLPEVLAIAEDLVASIEYVEGG